MSEFLMMDVSGAPWRRMVRKAVFFHQPRRKIAMKRDKVLEVTYRTDMIFSVIHSPVTRCTPGKEASDQ